MLEIGFTSRATVQVTKDNTAIALGSGDLEVFATPAMVALMESAAAKCVAESLGEESTSVGVQISVSHVKASGVDSQIVASAKVVSIEGRKVCFRVEAHDTEGLIGEGEHVRFIVDRAKFMQKISSL